MRGCASNNLICRIAAMLALIAHVSCSSAQQTAAAPAGATYAEDYQGQDYQTQPPTGNQPLQAQLPRRAVAQVPQQSAPTAPAALRGFTQPQSGLQPRSVSQSQSQSQAPAQPQAPAKSQAPVLPPAISRLPAVGASASGATRPAASAVVDRNRPSPVAPASYQPESRGPSVNEPATPAEEGRAGGRIDPAAPQQLQLQAGPQPPGEVAWSLPQVEATTFNFNPILRRSLARIESARGDALQAGLYPNPSFDTNNPQVIAGPATQYNVGFQQTIVVKGKLRLDRAAANEVVRQKEHGLTQDRFGLLLAVRQQFYMVLAAQRRREMLGQIREIAAASVRAADERRKAGEGTLSEVLLLQTELARTEIALQTAQTILNAERRQLAAIMGRPDLTIDQVTGQLTFGFPNFDENFLREFVVSQNAQVQIARREIDRNQILLRRAGVEPYPNMHGGPAYANSLASAPGTQQFWFNIQFDIPLWNRNQGNIRSTEGDLADSIASLGVLQNDLLRQVEEVLGRYRAARQAEERIRTQVLPTATRAQQLVKDGYQKGILDISTFLQAQRALSDATLSYIDALENVWTTAAEIATLLQLERFP